MHKLIRRVVFPEHIHVSGPLVKASLIRHAKDYQDLVELGKQDAAAIVERTQQEVKAIKEATRAGVLDELHQELQRMREVHRAFVSEQKAKVADLCVEICSVVIQRMIESQSEKERMRVLIQALLTESFSERELILQVNEAQKEVVQDTLSSILKTQFAQAKVTVQVNDQLQDFELSVVTPNKAQVSVSIDNLIYLYQKEVALLRSAIQDTFDREEEHHETSV